MTRRLGSHHASLTAPSREHVELAITAWNARFERELGELRLHPEGVNELVHDCCGTHTRRRRPSWLPAPEPAPASLSFRFEAAVHQRPGYWIAHVCAELYED